ncbi:hypothetical protein O181_058385 [Austropuccinia psidii MF-1]|uniref:Integrase catalytic domain-containing protein n=1 Tax=Austropuccinia psidii MF-1 TaxID=1389203 RepID=A0A9Q3E9K9_9BASI|nr:hypothetical protein [Austropuccinia psidii MF-1]
MDWVTVLPTGGERSFNACLVFFSRYSRTSLFLPFHKDETTMDTYIIIWNRFIIHRELFQNSMSDRDPRFTSALSTEYHPQTDGLAERIIQALEDMIRIFCAYGSEFKDSDGISNY